jgi:hypothetical protein
MRFEFTNHAPVSTLTPTGACTVSSASRVRVATPAAAIVLAARQLPIMQDQSAHRLIMAIDGGYTPVKETKPSNKLGGFRGVPPRRRPKV